MREIESAVNRRNVLKVLGTAGGAGTVLSSVATGATSGQTYDVHVFITEQLYQREGFTPQDNFISFLRGAFSNTSGMDVNAYGPNNTVPAPTQDSHSGSSTFFADDPCGSGQKEYDTLAHWWQDELNCNNYYEANDSTLLITDTDNEFGGWAFYDGNGTASVAEGGRPIATDGSYVKFGNSEATRAHRTGLEEVGHNLQRTNNDALISPNHKQYDHHQTGITPSTSSNVWVTPLGRTLCQRNDGQNVCGDSVDTSTCGYRDALFYSQCSAHYWNNAD